MILKFTPEDTNQVHLHIRMKPKPTDVTVNKCIPLDSRRCEEGEQMMLQGLIKKTLLLKRNKDKDDDNLRRSKSVFINYRRMDVMTARAVYENLTKHGYDCFLDCENIGNGSFEAIICQQIKDRDHFVVILTKDALQRCTEPGDFLRFEIETALTHRRNIVPLLFDGFDFQSNNKYMTGDLLPILTRYNGVPVPESYF